MIFISIYFRIFIIEKTCIYLEYKNAIIPQFKNK